MPDDKKKTRSREELINFIKDFSKKIRDSDDSENIEFDIDELNKKRALIAFKKDPEIKP